VDTPETAAYPEPESPWQDANAPLVMDPPDTLENLVVFIHQPSLLSRISAPQ
jgi:hypothetical protein